MRCAETCLVSVSSKFKSQVTGLIPEINMVLCLSAGGLLQPGRDGVKLFQATIKRYIFFYCACILRLSLRPIRIYVNNLHMQTKFDFKKSKLEIMFFSMNVSFLLV